MCSGATFSFFFFPLAGVINCGVGKQDACMGKLGKREGGVGKRIFKSFQVFPVGESRCAGIL